MKDSLLLWLIGLFGMPLCAQTSTEVIVTGHLKTDRSIYRGKDHLLEMRGAIDQIVYAYDRSSNSYVVKQYVSRRGCALWDGERTVKEKDKVRMPHYSNRITERDFQVFLSAFETNADSMPEYYGFVHTSHYYLSIYVDVVVNGDTTTWHKSQPFERSTPWQRAGRTILNPAIDAFVVAMLPKKFVGRDVLAKPRDPETNPKSMVTPALRVRDSSGKPAGLSSGRGLVADSPTALHLSAGTPKKNLTQRLRRASAFEA